MAKQVRETPWFREQIRNFGQDGKTPKHLMYATSLTKFGHINFDNRVNRRHGALKVRARNQAILNMPGKGDTKASAGELPFPNLARGTYHCVQVGFSLPKKDKKRREELVAEATTSTNDADAYKQKRVLEERESLEQAYA